MMLTRTSSSRLSRVVCKRVVKGMRLSPFLLQRLQVGHHLLGDMIAAPHVVFGVSLPLWAELGGLMLINILCVKVVMEGMRKLQDDSQPTTVVKLQIGLIHNHVALQRKLSSLADMIKIGQQGAWLVLEESILEIEKNKNDCEFAAMTQREVRSMKEAYKLFGRMDAKNLSEAKTEEILASSSSIDCVEAKCASAAGQNPKSVTMIPSISYPHHHPFEALQSFLGSPSDDLFADNGHLEDVFNGATASDQAHAADAPSSAPRGQFKIMMDLLTVGVDDVASERNEGLTGSMHMVDEEALVVTMVVVCKGVLLNLPESVGSWKDLHQTLQQLSSLSADRIMALELLWTPKEEGSSLTCQQMVMDYKELRSLRQNA
ncbi:hypothetical protein CEUSTIGMA_g8590.t1 [Chlamydomonas eustigma]|uniref:Uncharacterized protein n=1 Tax=Chlamydomonas eustigma TaxID=1157962 RepID=A0A250XDJ3_9CHLO|nr:hypothetical protein CEUSTIGMA_g8590.t1 [Chlamydomonas eustigma]|eukprot:GAX81157.1 hypothetical protein CEUSTIGMA_g8590.t1 [Chlamydomonas eustigma]